MDSSTVMAPDRFHGDGPTEAALVARLYRTRADAHLPAQPDLSASVLADILLSGALAPDARRLLLKSGAEFETAASLASLMESAARILAQRWEDDDCTELDVTVALGRIPSLFRALHRSRRVIPMDPNEATTVLVAPQPGELHMLRAFLDAELLWLAGMEVQCSYPHSTEELKGLVANEWYDVLDLSLSPLFRHDHLMGPMTRAIREVLEVSKNPDLVVVVSGRVFREDQGALRDSGGHLQSDSASDVVETVCGCETRCARCQGAAD